MALLSPSRRVRRTPFSDGVEAAGVKAYTVYNRMLLPTVFRSIEEDYRHLKDAVQVWDVACERQVELCGPDATKLMQLLTPRDLSRMKEGQCFYIPVVDENGGMLNDPVALRVGEDRWWASIADSDLLFWVKGLAVALRLDVSVTEPDVSPLAVQGPRAEALMADVFGDRIRELRFFGFARFSVLGKEMIIARSGYSRQGGFEIYVEGGEYGMPLWNILFEAGRSLDVHAGCPNVIERIEGGLLSYGNDMTIESTPYECGLGRFCDTMDAREVIGAAALRREATDGPRRQIRPIEIRGDVVPTCDRPWPVFDGNMAVGQVTSAAWSPDHRVNVAIGMIDCHSWDPGESLRVDTPEGSRDGIVQEAFWA